MVYKVIIMPPAKHRLDMYVLYTVKTLKNRQAAKSILADARETKRSCQKFARHKFVMIYRIIDNTVIVDGMFHELQDYEGIFTSELRLQ